MRDKKVTLLLALSFLLLFSSFLVLCVWGLRTYNRQSAEAARSLPFNSKAERDSLVALYNETVDLLEQKMATTYTNADKLEKNLQQRLKEYYRLRDELSALLQNPVTDADFEKARKKIDELQNSLRALRETNQHITKENHRLNEILQNMEQNISTHAVPATPVTNTSATQASTNTGSNSNTAGIPAAQNAVKTTPGASLQNTDESTVTKPVALFSTADLSFDKVNAKGNEEDGMELIGSFAVKNNGQISTNDDLMIVVVQPNGKVLQKSPWESGTFQTPEGKKIYSCKMRIENPGGGVKRVTFSLTGDKNLPGIYTVQIFHKGQLIGNLHKRV